MAHHHHHRRAHQLNAENEAELVVREPQRNLHNDDVATVVSVVFVTAQNTFPSTVQVEWITPTIANGEPVQATAVSNDDDHTTTASPKTTLHTTATVKVATKHTSHTTLQTSVSDQSDEILATSVKSTATKLVIAESTASLTATNTLAAASASSTAAAAAASGGSMSTGAKAGLALGVLILIAGVLALVLVVYKRKKDKKGQQLGDDEKAGHKTTNQPPPTNQIYSASAVRANEDAPQLSLRPVTQFSPNLDSGKFNTVQAPRSPSLLSPNASRENLSTPASSRPSSAWERKGASNAALSSPTNPFGDHAATADSPILPSTPTMASPAISKLELPSLPTISLEPEPAAERATVDANGSATGTAAAAAATAKATGLPKPIAVSTDSVGAPLPSPSGSTWTEDIPASPGPAPSGAPPAVSAAAGPPGPNNVHRVQMDFVPSMDDELEIRAGQLVRMLHEYDDGWALCVRLDRSQQGVVPRTCVSKHPVKPRGGPPRGPPPPRGPMGPMGPNVPRPLTPTGRNSPGPFSGTPRPLTPNGRNSPGPFANQPRPMSPGGRQMPPGGRPRANSNAPAYGRSMSPGPRGASNQFPSPPETKQRRRSNSASQVLARRNSPPGPSPLTQFGGGVPRKPVPGQAL